MEQKRAGSSKKKAGILYAVLGLSVGAVAFLAAVLTLEIYTAEQGQTYYSSLSAGAEQGTTDTYKPRQDAPSLHDYSVEPADAPEEHTSVMDFDSLAEISPNIVAWIKSEGTAVNYPIVKGEDNHFYLSHLPDGNYHEMGSIFLDYRNSADFSDENILIYGHDMRSGQMFGSLRHYRNQNYYEQYCDMFIFTPKQDYKLTLFAGYILDSAYETPPMDFNDSADFEGYIDDIKRRSIFKSDIPVSFGDRLVFLATCTQSGSINERLIIVGKLEDAGGECRI